MKHAIAALDTALTHAETHGLGDEIAAEYREAIGVLRRHRDRIGYNAGLLYEAYCTAVGGVAFNGDTLPDWETFSADPGKRKQVDAWMEVARIAAKDDR